MFSYQCCYSTGQSIPSWLSEPGKVLLKKYVMHSKYDPLVEEVDLMEANPNMLISATRMDRKQVTL